MIRTANPALNAHTFERFPQVRDTSRVMTLQGTVIKSFVLAGCVLSAATFTWAQAMSREAGLPWVLFGAIGGFVMALVTIFKKQWSPVTAPIYAILEGLFLGGISALFEMQYRGIVIQAAGLTVCTLVALLVAYVTRLIKATENFKLGVFAATGGIALMYLVTMFMGLFGMNIGFIHASGPIGIGISVFIVIIAALNLVLDFDFIENASASGAPKYMEWYGAFGLMVTLIWLYLEMLRLLSKINRR